MPRERDGAEDPLRKKMDDALADENLELFKYYRDGGHTDEEDVDEEEDIAPTSPAQQEQPKAVGLLSRLLGR